MIALIAVAAVVTGAAIYGIGAMQRNADPACRPSAELAKRLAPLARGEVAAINIAADPQKLPDLAFKDASGEPRKLSDFRGRTVLLNLWATWCVPCRKEMPALDALQARLGGDTFQVVAVNIDTRNLDKPKAWLDEVGIKGLGYFADPSAKVFQDLKAIGKALGMPTTLLIDPEGCELGVLAGPAEWASEDAIRLIEGREGALASLTPERPPRRFGAVRLVADDAIRAVP
ncbi:MAG: TlpA disulfide reductase family protein [Alphaproteobacteria bacterium]